MPAIYGQRIRLRAAERADIPMFVRWINDPEVTEHLTMYTPFGLEDETRWFERMSSAPMETHPLVIEVASTGDVSVPGEWVPIGNTSFFPIESINRSAEIGIMIGEKDYWNKGYGTDAMTTMCRHGFETLNLHRIWLRVDDNNLRGIRAYEKAGFIHEGRYRDGNYKHGHYNDVLIMSVLKEDWQKISNKEG